MDRTPEQIAADLTPHLALLDALRTHGNLTVAAAAIGVPQPTASRWLAGLADTVGTALVVRTGRQIALTAAGAALAEAASTALATVAAGTARAVEAADPRRGHVRFAFLHTMGTSRVPALLSGFRAAYPRIRFTLVHAGHDDMLASLRDGTVDLALTSPLPTDPDLSVAQVYTDDLVLVVPATHRFATRTRIRLAACRDESFVGLKPGYGLRRMTDALYAAAGFSPRATFEGDDTDTVRGLVAAGLGIAVLPSREAGPLWGTVELALSPRASRRIGLVASTRRPLPPAADTFREWVLGGVSFGG